MMKSRSATASMLLALGSANPRSRARASRSMGNAVPARAAEPSGITLTRPRHCAEALAVPRQHEDVGQQMMGEEHRLRALEVRVARHPARLVLLGAGEQRRLRPGDRRVDVTEHVAQVEPLVERDLVVPGASGVELAAERARQLDEPPLDVHVDVLELLAERKATALELGAHGGEALQQPDELVLPDQAGPLERPRPRLATHEIVRPEAAVEPQRGRERLGGGIGAAGETPGPGLVEVLAARARHEAPARLVAARTGSRSTARRAAISAMMSPVSSCRSARGTRA